MTDTKTTLITIPSGMEELITAERPSGIDEGDLGNEGMTREDILMPRLGLAQKMSPEIDPTNQEKYIEGLQFTDLFNSLTKARYGKGPLYFSILRRDQPRYVEFTPIDQGGGIEYDLSGNGWWLWTRARGDVNEQRVLRCKYNAAGAPSNVTRSATSQTKSMS